MRPEDIERQAEELDFDDAPPPVIIDRDPGDETDYVGTGDPMDAGGPLALDNPRACVVCKEDNAAVAGSIFWGGFRVCARASCLLIVKERSGEC